MPKKFILIGIFSLIFLLGIFGAFYLSNSKKVSSVPQTSPPSSTTDLLLKPSTNNLKVGEKMILSVYAAGRNVEKITAYDIRFDYDKEFLKLTSGTPGNFFNRYLEIKSDKESAWFAVSVNPEDKNLTPNISYPLLTLEFTALKPTKSVSIKTDSETIFYIPVIGGLKPESQTVILDIK